MLLAHWRYHMVRHGWPLPLALALLAAMVGIELLGVQPLRARTQALETAQAASLTARSQALGPKQTQQLQLANFYASLPTATGALEAIATIQQAADANGVVLAHGEYRLSRDASLPLMRYQITLPARSEYPQLRAWLSDVMNAIPALALDEFSLRRDDSTRDAVDARVRLTLFMRAS